MESLGLFSARLLLSFHGGCALLQHLSGVLLSLGTPLQKQTPVPPISRLVPVIHTLLTRAAGIQQSEMERKQPVKCTAPMPACSALLLNWTYRNLNTTSDSTSESTQRGRKWISTQKTAKMFSPLSLLHPFQRSWLSCQPYNNEKSPQHEEFNARSVVLEVQLNALGWRHQNISK